MKLVVSDAKCFKPVSITIQVETLAELRALHAIGAADSGVPDAAVRWNPDADRGSVSNFCNCLYGVTRTLLMAQGYDTRKDK